MGAAGSLWWLWAWAVWMGFNLLLLVIYPTFIAPLFNKFKPLEDETLKARVTALMQRCGFAAKGLFVMDGSKRSAHANAYFTGFGAAKRVVFYDTLLSKLSPGEVDAVLAHELGHFKHKHIVKRIVGHVRAEPGRLRAAGLAVDAGLVLHRPGRAAQPGRAQRRAGAAAVHAGRAGVHVLHLAAVGAAVAQARVRGRRLSRCSRPAAPTWRTALLKLYEDNASTLTPDPVFVKFYYSHPPASERLARMAAAELRMTHRC